MGNLAVSTYTGFVRQNMGGSRIPAREEWMVYRLPIQSRLANLLLMAIGALFLVAGLGTLAFAIASTWGYAGITERIMQLVLIGCAAFGALLVIGARRNLAQHPGHSRRAVA
jgi:hypothetical protein